MFMSGDFGGQRKCLKSEECSWSHLVATLNAWDVALSCWNCPNPSECTISGVPYHANCTRPIPLQRLHQIEQSPVDKQGLWINDVVSILVHVHPSDTIGNETHQTRQCVSNHQQSNGSVVRPKRGVKHCTVQAATVHEWAFSSGSPY
ncbi:hypothetical protein AVEN_69767-1 [Araneus ventricosus]|uniref:Uncharacterized protein n=1 Tax=Araneus ventricosus TaxID=182803 RepID=A0A4Y2CWU3_ARAVE|nr:hypothetical protein AVEN_69767-1 [Araneus ventricosus]